MNNLSPFKARTDTLEALKSQVAHWQHNHSDMVERCALLSQRHDLPIDRIQAYKYLIRVQEDNIKLKQELAELETKYAALPPCLSTVKELELQLAIARKAEGISDGEEAWFVGGPGMQATVYKYADIEQYVNAACKQTGDGSSEYTATKIIVTMRAHPDSVCIGNKKLSL